jgi:hypothetical protein
MFGHDFLGCQLGLGLTSGFSSGFRNCKKMKDDFEAYLLTCD